MLKIPFNFGLFFHALKGLVGREPDRKVLRGYDGYYEFIYEAQNDQERISFLEAKNVVAGWLDLFDITLGSRCECGGRGSVLDIRITHPKQP